MAKKKSNQKLLGIGIIGIIAISIAFIFLDEGEGGETGFYEFNESFPILFDLRLVGGTSPHITVGGEGSNTTTTTTTLANGTVCDITETRERTSPTTITITTATDCGFTTLFTTEFETTEPTFDNQVSSLLYWIDSSDYQNECLLKMTTNAVFTDGTKRSIQSRADQTLGLQSLFDRSGSFSSTSGKEISKYDNNIKLFCDNLRDRDGNILEMIVTPNSDMKVKTVANDNKGSEITIKTSSLLNPRPTTMKTNTFGFGEFTIATSSIRASDIELKLPETVAEYPSFTRHIVEGTFNIEIPFLTEKFEADNLGKHTGQHLIHTNYVQNTHLVTISKIKEAPPFLGGGQEVKIVSWNPKIIDSRSATQSSRTIDVTVSMDKWVQDEGLPFMEIIKSNNQVITKIQMNREGSSGDDTFFKANYIVPIRADAGTYKIKAESNTVFGINARPNTPSVNFEVTNTGAEREDCPDGSSVPSGQTCPVEEGSQLCLNGTVILLSETCPEDTGDKIRCPDGTIVLRTEGCGNGNGTNFDLKQFLESVGLGGNNLLFAGIGFLAFILLIAIITRRRD